MKYKVEWLDKFIKDFTKDTNKALLYIGEYLEEKLKEQIRIDSYDTWTFANSITYRLVRDWVLEVGSNLIYSVVREEWRKPWKFPPLDALVGWTARKGMISWGATSTYDNLDNKDKGTVFVIARAIAKNGIEWKHSFQKVYEREKQNILKIYIEYMNNA